jgi:hypothetical protein
MAFRRFRRPLFRGLPPDVETALLEARRLLQIGQYAQAGAVFAQLAAEAGAHGRSRAAAEMHARAANCLVSGGDESASLAQSQAALRLFAQQGMPQRRQRFLENMAHKMESRGMTAALSSLRAEFGGVQASGAPLPPPRRPRLPAACPQCGAPVRSDEVEWIDDSSAECVYCGATLQG